MTPRARRRGFTLVEALLAAALAALIVLAAVRLAGAARGLGAAATDASDRALALGLGTDLLAAELRRAGFEPFPSSGLTLPADGPDLTLTLRPASPAGDSVRVRYVDDGLADGPVVRDLVFSAGTDGRGVPQLYRATYGGRRQPLVEGVEALRVAGWVDAAGRHTRSEVISGPLQPWLLLLRVSAAGGDAWTLAVPLPSRPRTEVTSGG